MTVFDDVAYRSGDGRLDLYARDYGEPSAGAMTVLCLHGLTRNSADFEFIAARLSGRYRVVAADQRGRGRSQTDPEPVNYALPVYVQDMFALLDHLRIGRCCVIGTSMGGLMAMIMASLARERIIGAVLNDIGPRIEMTGLARIASYTGKTRPAANWAEAAENARLINEIAFPDYGADDWMAFARRLYREDENGAPVLAYDPAISRGLEAGSEAPVAPPDLWPLWDTLDGLPMLAIRGALSDLLSADTLDEMKQRHAGLETLTVANRGHAPMLDEPPAVAAIDAFLGRLAANQGH
ncbi:MAG: alpha/beta fold hydrolase [Asticcacaulis sp.]